MTEREKQLEAENLAMRGALVAISTGCTGRDTSPEVYADITLERVPATERLAKELAALREVAEIMERNKDDYGPLSSVRVALTRLEEARK